MIKIQGISLVNVKEFVGREGYGFNAEIKMGNTKVGTVNDYADGSGMVEIYVREEYKVDFDKAVERFSKGMKDDIRYQRQLELDGLEEHVLISFILENKNLEKEARKMFKDGFDRVFIVAAYLTVDEVAEKDLWDAYSDRFLYGINDPSETKESLLKRVTQRKGKEHLNYVMELKSLKDLSFKF